ncbi:MAG: hypothetical protein HY703_08935 [Gemmatimonadetes bacterium]|nr:hypothetical protein [Gemmatimonadota bacterium]
MNRMVQQPDRREKLAVLAAGVSTGLCYAALFVALLYPVVTITRGIA